MRNIYNIIRTSIAFIPLSVLAFISGCGSSSKELSLNKELFQLLNAANLNDTLFEVIPRKIFWKNENTGFNLKIVVPDEESQRLDNLLHYGKNNGYLLTETITEESPGQIDYYNYIIPTESGKSFISEGYNSETLKIKIGYTEFDTITNVISHQINGQNIYYVNYKRKIKLTDFFQYFYPSGQVQKYYYVVIGEQNGELSILDNGYEINGPVKSTPEGNYDTTHFFHIPTKKIASKLINEHFSTNSDSKSKKMKLINVINIVATYQKADGMFAKEDWAISYANIEIEKEDNSGQKIREYAIAQFYNVSYVNGVQENTSKPANELKGWN